jgi:hypothetical protein
MPEGTDTAFYGRIEEGRRFGVRIGDSRYSARQIMAESGYKYVSSAVCGYNIRILDDCFGSGSYDIYIRTNGIFREHVYIKVNLDFVRTIVWSVNIGPHVDL